MFDNATVSLILGSLLLVFVAVSFFLTPKLTRDQRRIMAIISMLLAGALGFFIGGIIAVQVEAEMATGTKLTIQAGGAAAFAVLAWISWFFVMPGDRADEEQKVSAKNVQGQSTGPGGIGTAVGNSITINNQAVNAETLDKIINRYETNLNRLEQDKAEIRKQLEAAEARVAELAKAGNEDAKQAIEAARASGDIAQLQTVLTKDADRRGDAIKEQMADYLALCREIATVAFMRGDIAETERRLTIILRADPDDLFAVNQMGHVLQLRGDLPGAEKQYRRLLKLAPDRYEVKAVALVHCHVMILG